MQDWKMTDCKLLTYMEVDKGHRVKVKVTGTKKVKNPYSCSVKLRSLNVHNSGSVKDTAMRFACLMGFSDMADRMV